MGHWSRFAFIALVGAQAAHSVEEYVFRLYDRFAPARYVSEALGFDRPAGFIVFNVSIVLFGLWCWVALVRRGHRSARAIGWAWALVEIANGLAHIALAAANGGYFPGLATAPLLLGAGAWLVTSLLRNSVDRSGRGLP